MVYCLGVHLRIEKGHNKVIEYLTASRRMNTCSEDDKVGGTKDLWLVWCLVGIAARRRMVDFNLFT